jgi:hypothetical protein
VAVFMGDPSNTQPDPSGNATLSEVDILWLTAGLGCDGDTIAMTGATQPSIEDIVTGALPWIPKVKLYNPFLAYENGEDFVRPFREAAEGTAHKPFILIVEGSIPDEKSKSEGYWASFGTDSLTGQPILTCDWIRSSRGEGLGDHCYRDVRDLRRDSCDEKGIPLAAWDCLTIWDGSGSRRPESRSCACRVVVSDAHGLMSALQLYASEIEDLFGIGCRFHCETAVLIHDVAAATHLYHIAQKAVNNAIKHGHANNILIRLFSGDQEGTLIIQG